MVALGYKLMSEEHGPVELIRNAQRAEEAGFEFAAISDHYFPWLPEEATPRSPGRCWAASRRPPSGLT